VAIRFFSIPSHHLVTSPKPLPSDLWVEARLPTMEGVLDRALSGAEFRDMRAKDLVRALLANERVPRLGAPGPDFGPSVVFAQPPDDLPALLRLADQLESLAHEEEGERAMVWKCPGCGTRYAVPVTLVREVAIKCERCQSAVDLKSKTALGEESLVDPLRGAANTVRHELAVFFREAMARGWPVLVSAQAARQ
jgi:hypothetical protein